MRATPSGGGPSAAIAPGFGARLREERVRLGMSQTQFGEIAGVRRLTQRQYEQEASYPTIKYLAAVGARGVNLEYVLFGRAPTPPEVSEAVVHRIEKRAFSLVEEYARSKGGREMSADERFVLFQVLRAHLLRVAGGEENAQVSVEQIAAGRSSAA